MGEAADEAPGFCLQEDAKVDPSEWIRYQAVFQNNKWLLVSV